MIESFVTFLPVRDLEATHAFYHGLLGLPLVRDQGRTRIYQVSDGAYLGFTRDDSRARTRVILSLISDPDDWYIKLCDAGVKTDAPPRKHPQLGFRHFFAQDPDGYRVEFQTMF